MAKPAFLLILFSLTVWLKLAAQEQQDLAFASVRMDVERRNENGSGHLSFSELDDMVKGGKAGKTILSYTKQNRPVEAYYFPGKTNKKALVIGGVHGSELSAIELAKSVVDQLANGESSYSVIVIPVLFPDNAAMAKLFAGEKKINAGRYTAGDAPDPNRQMPALGTPFDENNPVDVNGRLIENENAVLLQLIQDFQPSRIVTLHAIRDVTKAGIYADPRTDCKGLALGFAPDSTLAVSMATFISENGGYVPGNKIKECPTALYYNDPEPAMSGSIQKRNLHGSPLPNNRGYGVSLGGWASTAVCSAYSNREAIQLITIEFPGYRDSQAYPGDKGRKICLRNIFLYGKAITNIFLSAPDLE
jgi:hypothetical protein